MKQPHLDSENRPRAAGRRLLCALAMSVLLATPLLALNPTRPLDEYGLDVWGLNSGLPSNSVNALVQTPDGYLWVATWDGLARFDGVRFAVFRPANAPGLLDDSIRDLALDQSGAMWIATNNGGISRYARGVFKHYGEREGLTDRSIWALQVDRHGVVWAGSAKGHLFRFDQGRFVRDAAAPFDRGISTIAATRDDNVWVGTFGGGAARRMPDGNWVDVSSKLPSKTVGSIAEDQEGTIWIGTNGGITRLVMGDAETYPLAEGVQVWSVYVDRHGAVWVGGLGGRVARLSEGKFDVASPSLGIPVAAISAICEDDEGSVWLGTYSGGLLRLRDASFVTRSTRHGVIEDVVYSAAESKDGTLYVGTADGVSRLSEGVWDTVLATGNGVRSLTFAPDGSLWAGTFGGGIGHYVDGAWTFFREKDGLANDSVRTVAIDREGAVWAATFDGLSVYKNGKFRNWRAKDGLPSSSLVALVIARDGTVWVGTEGAGLLRLRDGRIEQVGKKELGEAVVLGLAQTRDGAIWAAMRSGIARIDESGIRTFDERQGLEGWFSQIIEGDDGSLWLGGSIGVTRLQPDAVAALLAGRRFHFDTFGVSDGLGSPQCTPQQGSIRGAATGRLYFPTLGGLSWFDPHGSPQATPPPRVHVEEIFVDGRPVASGATLPSTARNLEIRYTAPTFVSPDHVQFRYRLAGFDEQWVNVGARRVAYYPFIPPGDHRFEVEARVGRGEWTSRPASVTFTMRPRYYQTYWFPLVVTILVAALVAAVVRGLILVQRSRRKSLQIQVAVRTAEIEKLGELTEKINEAVLFEEVLSHTYEVLRGMIPYNRIGFAMLEDDGRIVRAAWARGDNPHVAIDVGYESPLEGSSLKDVLDTGQPRILSDLEAYLAEHPGSDSTRKIVSEGIRSSLTLPLRALGKPVGFLFFSSNESQVYNESHVRFLKQIAGQLSLTISKSLLYNDLLDTKAHLERANRELEALAAIDGLTGIANRRTFDASLDREWRRAVRTATPISLLIIDVDYFKNYNDLYGHAQGDECLQAVAVTLQLSVRRAGDLLARYGGEEFAVVLPDCGEDRAHDLAERLRSQVAGLGMPHAQSVTAPYVTISIGGATFIPDVNSRLSDLVEAADRALYEAKNSGRDRVVHSTRIASSPPPETVNP